jgi:cold shock CspA family protein
MGPLGGFRAALLVAAALTLGSASGGMAMLLDFSSAPVLEPIPDQSVDELNQLTVTARADDPDLPNDVLRFSLAGGPVGASITPGGRITWTPSESHGPGDFTFTVRVEDAAGEVDQESFLVTVEEINTAPEIGSIPDQALGSGDRLNLQVTASDPDEPANALTFSGVGLPPGVTVDAATGVITGTVTATEAGKSGVATVTVTDGGSPPREDTTTFSWLITTGNRAPTMEPLDGQNAGADGVVRFTVAATDGDSDDMLSFWLADGIDPVPQGATMDATSGEFTWEPTESQYDSVYQFNVGVSDSGSPRLSATQLVTVTLPEYNVAPEVEPFADQSSAEGVAVSLQVSATDVNSGDTLRYFATGLPAGLQLDATTGAITGEVGYEAAAGSPYAVTVTVTDDGIPEGSTDTSFGWQVDNTNRPPELESTTIVAIMGEDTRIRLEAVDPDGDPLVYTVVTAPTNGRLEGELPSVTYINIGGSRDRFVVAVGDGEIEVEATISIELREENFAPEAGVDEYSLAVGGHIEIEAPGVLGNDFDPDGEPLTATVVAAPDHGELVLDPDGSFTYAADPGYVGADKFTYAAVDALGERGTGTVVLNMADEVAEPGPDEPLRDDGLGSTIVAATMATWRQPDVDGGAIDRLQRAAAAVVVGGLSSLSYIGYPLLLLAAALLLALTVGRVALTPAGAGRTQHEGIVDWYDPDRGFGRIIGDDGTEEVFVHAGSIVEADTLIAGQRVEFIAADIKGRRVTLKVWPNS